MASIRFLPFDKKIKLENGLSLMQSASLLRLPIYSTCGAKGTCGNYIDPLDACEIDLFPGWNSAPVTGVGNAAGYGACLSLLNRNKRKEAQKVAITTNYQELAASERFQELFVSNMFFTSAVDYDEDPAKPEMKIED
ncbi:hypothetical protein D1AOALGA4SA_12515 [Olavius algarvensis Delta 1 endosymbiont]|nr:hypothetical protein D1AOALGA4SA_12515 [Olavius algarvensis Delta 1 endosymbiont]